VRTFVRSLLFFTFSVVVNVIKRQGWSGSGFPVCRPGQEVTSGLQARAGSDFRLAGKGRKYSVS